MAREELLSPDDQPEDAGLLLDEPGLRPKTLSEFVGQSELKGHLGVMLGAAARRREAADPYSSPVHPASANHARQHHRRRDGHQSPDHVGSRPRAGG